MLKCLNVLSVERKDGIGKLSGKPYSLLVLQGVMEYSDGRCEVFVYDWFPRRDEPLPDLKPGRYLPTVEPMPNNQSRKLEARIVSFQPLKVAA